MKTSRIRKSPEITLVYVNFRSVGLLRRSLRALSKQRIFFRNIEIIVINNDPSEAWALRALSREFPLRLIEVRKNKGFGSAANLAVRHVRTPYIGFINPDTELLSGNIGIIPDLFRKHPHIGVLGARLVSHENAPELWSAGEDITLWQVIRNNVGIPAGKRIWKSGKPRKAGFVSGAALFTRKDLFDEVGGFDEGFFLYFEDADFCLRLKRIGYRIFSFPGIIFRHDGGASHASSRAKKEAFYESQERYFGKHRPKWEGRILSVMKRIFL